MGQTDFPHQPGDLLCIPQSGPFDHFPTPLFASAEGPLEDSKKGRTARSGRVDLPILPIVRGLSCSRWGCFDDRGNKP